MRIGFGYDSHAFDPDRPLILGGVHLPGIPGLMGHSDGDAVAHAVTDALLGAAAIGDIGTHFPPEDSQWEGADSIKLLRKACALVASAGYAVGNVDVTVICETPKIRPIAGAMRRVLAEALSVELDQVSIKGKTNERMGWEGRSEGLAVHAVALLYTRS